MGPVTKRFEMGTTEQIQNDVRVLKRSFYHEPIPDNAVPFFATGSVPTPAYSDPATLANQVVLATYQCPIGWEGFLMDVMLSITGEWIGKTRSTIASGSNSTSIWERSR